MHNKYVLHDSSSSYSSVAICMYFQGQTVYLCFDFLYPWAGHNSETYMGLNKGRKVRGRNQFSNNKAVTRPEITQPDLQPIDKKKKKKITWSTKLKSRLFYRKYVLHWFNDGKDFNKLTSKN